MTLQVICTVVDDVGLVPTAGTIETTETFETCQWQFAPWHSPMILQPWKEGDDYDRAQP
jgi:hypothetical protein